MPRKLHSPWLPRALPFAVYMLFLALGDRPAAWFGLADPRWLYGLRVATVAALLLAFARHYRELRLPPAPAAREWLLAVAVGLGVFVAWINLAGGWLVLSDEPGGFDPRAAGGQLDPALVAVRIAGAALVVPVMEELFWRSFILRWIDNPRFLDADPRAMSLRAVLWSSVIFGLEHNEWFAGILAGAAYAWLYRRGHLGLAVAGHAVTNLVLGVWVVTTGSWRFW